MLFMFNHIPEQIRNWIIPRISGIGSGIGSLVWDVTVPDSLAPSYRPVAVTKQEQLQPELSQRKSQSITT